MPLAPSYEIILYGTIAIEFPVKEIHIVAEYTTNLTLRPVR